MRINTMTFTRALTSVTLAALLFSALGTMPVSAAEISVPGDHSTIQAAIDAADPGDTINVASGTYDETITINKQLTVQSTDGAETTVIDRGNMNTTLVSITADGVIFSGFTVQNARNGVSVTSSDNTIKDNVVADISRWSMTIRGENNLVENNVIRDQGSWGTERQPRGLFLYGAESVTATGNELINAGLSFQDILDPLDLWLSHDIDETNTVNGKLLIYWKQRSGESVPQNAGTVWLIDCENIVVENLELKDTETGIYVAYGNGGNTIQNNTVGGGDAILSRRNGEWNIGWRGIIVRQSQSNMISGNTVLDTRGGIEVRAADNNDIVANIVDGSREGIVVANSDGTAVVNNETSRCSDAGVLLWSNVVEDTIIEGNNIFDNKIGIHFAHGHSFPSSTVLNNCIVGNTEWGVQMTGDEVIDGRDNWWGDPSGPSGGVADPETGVTADGTGDSVSENVRFDPWLDEAPPCGIPLPEPVGGLTTPINPLLFLAPLAGLVLLGLVGGAAFVWRRSITE